MITQFKFRQMIRYNSEFGTFDSCELTDIINPTTELMIDPTKPPACNLNQKTVGAIKEVRTTNPEFSNGIREQGGLDKMTVQQFQTLVEKAKVTNESIISGFQKKTGEVISEIRTVEANRATEIAIQNQKNVEGGFNPLVGLVALGAIAGGRHIWGNSRFSKQSKRFQTIADANQVNNSGIAITMSPEDARKLSKFQDKHEPAIKAIVEANTNPTTGITRWNSVRTQIQNDKRFKGINKPMAHVTTRKTGLLNP